MHTFIIMCSPAPLDAGEPPQNAGHSVIDTLNTREDEGLRPGAGAASPTSVGIGLAPRALPTLALSGDRRGDTEAVPLASATSAAAAAAAAHADVPSMLSRDDGSGGSGRRASLSRTATSSSRSM